MVRGGGGGDRLKDDSRMLGTAGKSKRPQRESEQLAEEKTLSDDEFDGDSATGADEGKESYDEAGEEEARDEEALDAPREAAPPASAPVMVRERRSQSDAKLAKKEARRNDVGRLSQLGYLRAADSAAAALDGVYSRSEAVAYDELDGLFPALPDAPTAPAKLPWPDEVLALLQQLDRRAAIAAASGGVRITSSGSSVDRRGRTHVLAHAEWLLAKDAWLQVTGHRDHEAFNVSWLRGDERGAWRADWLLGRVRARKPATRTAGAAPTRGRSATRSRATATGRRRCAPTARAATSSCTSRRRTSPATSSCS
jgi:hypothetical protein